MYETHNPGFCYHCTGAIKENGLTTKQRAPKDSYEFVRSIVFTDDQVDPRKVLCLHLLTAHSTRWNDNDDSTIRPVTSLLEKAKNKHYSGAWNNILPCYVVDREEAWNGTTPENVKLHEDPRKLSLEDQAIRDFEAKCRQYMDNNVDFDEALSTNAKHTRIALGGLEKMPTISPHVYSLLGPSHELRIKQALAKGVVRKKFVHSNMELDESNEKSLSFCLDDDDDDDLSSRTTTDASNRNWVARSTHSPSRRSTIGSSRKLDRGITMLKSKRSKPREYMAYRSKNDDTQKGLMGIKSSFRVIKGAPSKTSSTKSPFRSIFDGHPSTNSLLSATLSPETIRRYRKCIYLNTPARCIELRNKDHRIVPILVNYQIQALVQTVLEVLERVNPDKWRKIIETAKNTDEIKKMLLCPEIQNFAQSLLGQSMMSSPECFVVSVATVANEIDFQFERVLEKEIVALTLEIPSAPSLYALVSEIRNNIFLDTKKTTQPKDSTKKISLSPNEQKHEKENNEKMYSNYDKKMPRANKNRKDRKDSLKGNEKNKLPKENSDDITEKYFERCPKKSLKTRTGEQRISSGNILATRTSNAKTWKGAQDLGHLDADHVILRRMTNTQRILVGQMCASLKGKRINNQGLINETVPLAALITPALSRDSIKLLTRGTMYAKPDTVKKQQEGTEDNVAVPDKLTGPLLAKIRQDIAENETKQRLKYFLTWF
ncbi:uncharacterized protein LOC122398456 [Colletes gigas]|uniref:uncharacterized protein LOC122398456 n=1 Tax=Colletes gigas TaxID=935657 RepID=UPI001C9A746E|nr:uncharacterized protein LOC122398456 [Colletes gigas]